MTQSRFLLAAMLALLASCGIAVGTSGSADSAPASAPPGTDVYLFEVERVDGGLRVVGGSRPAGRNLTDRAGYDNQPAFAPDGASLLYTSIRSDGQADIYRIALASGRTDRVMRTPESEYSPTPMPNADRISTVRVEMDSTQRLWSFAPNGSGATLVLADIRPVGYHAWIDDRMLALFVLGTPPTLQIADARTGEAWTAASGIGRSLLPIPGTREVSFVQRSEAEGEWEILALDVDTREIRPLARTLRDSEDLAWTPSGELLTGHGSMLYRWEADSGRWIEVADLEPAGVRDITRIAVSPGGDRIAVVGSRD
jgi:hypothetical protein